MRIALLFLLGACGTRGSLATAGPGIAEELAAPRVLYFGDGCYAAEVPSERRWTHPQIVACSVDVLPNGERLCKREPDFDFGVGYYPSRSPLESQVFEHLGGARRDFRVWMAALDLERRNREIATFVAQQNDHRCHRRWLEQLECEPVQIQAKGATTPMRASHAPWPSDLGTLSTRMEVPEHARDDAYAVKGNFSIDVELCIGKDGVVSPSWGYFHGHGTSAFFREALVEITNGITSEQRGTCVTAALAFGPVHCANPSATVQMFPGVRPPHR